MCSIVNDKSNKNCNSEEDNNNLNKDLESISPRRKTTDLNTTEVVKSPRRINYVATPSDGSDDEHSQYEAILSADCKDVSLTRERPKALTLPSRKRRVLKISPEELSSPDSQLSDNEIDKILSPDTDSQDDCLENAIIDQIKDIPEPIPELTSKEEREESRCWRSCSIAGEQKKIDLKVIEPYKRILSHGGYLSVGSHNAIIVFSACFLPHRSRVDYNYVMDNLFLYVLSTLNQLVTDDYVLVYLHGGTAKDCIPTFSWLKKCYQMVDRKLKKNLKSLYLVHPTFWLKTLMVMIKPFISSKFSHKINFINSLSELLSILPLEQASIPDRVQQYDRIKQSLNNKKS